jgi:CRISPR-associated protein Cas6
VNASASTVTASMVDMVFPLRGTALPRDHRWALVGALSAALPWMKDEPGVCVHDVNLVHGSGATGTGRADSALLSARSRLVVRAPRARLPDLAGLAGCSLQVDEFPLQLGQAWARELLPHATLYAHFVASTQGDEAGFLQAMQDELAAMDARCHMVCGKAQRVRAATGEIHGYSLMLHGLSRSASLRVLQRGLGSHRLMGCGVFVPHKSAAAVGGDD